MHPSFEKVDPALDELASEFSKRIVHECNRFSDPFRGEHHEIMEAIESCEKSAIYVDHHGEELRMQVEEVKRFYASLFLLRSRCIDGDDERYTFVPGPTNKKENCTSDVGCQTTVYLKHDQYQALEEILNELPNAMDRHRRNFRHNGDRYSSKFSRTYAAKKCNSSTTWTDGGSISYQNLSSIRDRQVEGLEPLLLGAEAFLRLLCETVPNFEVSWLNCRSALDSSWPSKGYDVKFSWLVMPMSTTEMYQYTLLRAWFRSPEHWQPIHWSGAPLVSNHWGCRKDYHLATRLKSATRLLSLRFASSLFSNEGRQPHSYLGGRVKAVQQDRTNMVPTRKELPMIIGGQELKAQHDSGAERGNFMDCGLSSKLKLRLRNEKGDCKRFSMGNGKIVKALGRVKAVCAFAKEAQTKMKCWFYVFDELASPLIMGSQFLEKTKTLSDYVHRLEDCISNPGILPMVNLIGSTQHAKRRFTAHIDHRYTLTNADTGSDLDLMSSPVNGI